MCHLSGVQSILSRLFYFVWKLLLANNIGLAQTPHNVVSYVGLNCLPLTLLRVSRLEWVNEAKITGL